MLSARRQLLKGLPFALGFNLLASRLELGEAAQTGVASQSSPTEKEHVTGIGGFFFRAHDPDALGKWYQQQLGITLTPTTANDPVWRQDAGVTAFTPFPQTTKYFGDLQKSWMINFRVANLDRMVAQLTAAGIAVKIESENDPSGRFAHLHDPEGNPIELWEPK